MRVLGSEDFMKPGCTAMKAQASHVIKTHEASVLCSLSETHVALWWAERRGGESEGGIKMMRNQRNMGLLFPSFWN